MFYVFLLFSLFHQGASFELYLFYHIDCLIALASVSLLYVISLFMQCCLESVICCYQIVLGMHKQSRPACLDLDLIILQRLWSFQSLHVFCTVYL